MGKVWEESPDELAQGVEWPQGTGGSGTPQTRGWRLAPAAAAVPPKGAAPDARQDSLAPTERIERSPEQLQADRDIIEQGPNIDTRHYDKQPDGSYAPRQPPEQGTPMQRAARKAIAKDRGLPFETPEEWGEPPEVAPPAPVVAPPRTPEEALGDMLSELFGNTDSPEATPPVATPEVPPDDQVM